MPRLSAAARRYQYSSQVALCRVAPVGGSSGCRQSLRACTSHGCLNVLSTSPSTTESAGRGGSMAGFSATAAGCPVAALAAQHAQQRTAVQVQDTVPLLSNAQAVPVLGQVPDLRQAQGGRPLGLVGGGSAPSPGMAGQADQVGVGQDAETHPAGDSIAWRRPIETAVEDCWDARLPRCQPRPAARAAGRALRRAAAALSGGWWVQRRHHLPLVQGQDERVAQQIVLLQEMAEVLEHVEDGWGVGG